MLLLYYVYWSFRARLRANVTTIVSVALFVTGSCLGLTFYLSLRALFVDGTPPDNVLVLSTGASQEAESQLSPDAESAIAALPGVARRGDVALVAREAFSTVFLDPSDSVSLEAAVALRGIDELSVEVHHATIVAGRPPAPGSLELLAGQRAADKYPALAIGRELHLPGGVARVSGIFTVAGGPAEDEVWTPRPALERHAHGDVATFMTAVADSPARIPELVRWVDDHKELAAYAAPAGSSLADVAGVHTVARTLFALLVLLAVVATFALSVAMHAAVEIRIPELAALAAIGIRKGLLARLIALESVFVAVIGAVIGVSASGLIGSRLGKIEFVNNLNTVVDMTFSPTVLVLGLGLGLFVGVVASVAPAIRIRRLDIVHAMR